MTDYAYRTGPSEPWTRCDFRTAHRVQCFGFMVAAWADAEKENRLIVEMEREGRKFPSLSPVMSQLISEDDQVEIQRRRQRRKWRATRATELNRGPGKTSAA